MKEIGTLQLSEERKNNSWTTLMMILCWFHTEFREEKVPLYSAVV